MVIRIGLGLVQGRIALSDLRQKIYPVEPLRTVSTHAVTLRRINIVREQGRIDRSRSAFPLSHNRRIALR
jgi:hypothetical protein